MTTIATRVIVRSPNIKIQTVGIQGLSGPQGVQGPQGIQGPIGPTGPAGPSVATSLQTGRTISITGDASWTSPPFDGTANITAPLTLSTVTQGSGGSLLKISLDTKGRVISNAAVTQADITSLLGTGSITNLMLANSAVSNLSGVNTGDQTITLTGDVTGSGVGSFAATLATVNSNIGSFGSASNIPVLTVNAKGLITAVSNTAIQITESQVTNLTTDLGLKAPIASPTFTGTVTLPGDPASALQAATKQYVDNAILGLNAKPGVRVASTANVNISSPGAAIDGITLNTLDRVLLKNQTASSQNGIYIFNGSSSAMTRALDQDVWSEVPGSFVFVEVGTTNADTGWLCTADSGGTLGTTAITWTQFNGAGAISAGTGISISGNLISLASLTDGGTGSLLKITRDSYGRISGTTAVTQSDIVNLLGAGSLSESQVSNLTTDLANKQATLVSGTNIKTVNGSSLLGSGNLTINSTATQYTDSVQTATAGQTTFTISYTVGYIDVYINGLRLSPSDYTATNGTSVVLGVGANLNDEVLFRVWTTVSITNAIYNTDTGTVTNTMLAGSIANNKLSNSSVTIGTTNIALGGTATDIAGLGSITTTGATGLSLTNGTSNLIHFNSAGLALPTTTTRSAGTRIVYYPSINSTNYDYATGVHSDGTLWTSIPSSTSSFKWYTNTGVLATLDGTGNLTVAGTVSGGSATGFRNKIINGAMEVNQPGFTTATASSSYLLDMYQAYTQNTGATWTLAAGFSGFKNSLRAQRNNGTSNLGYISAFVYNVESIESAPLAGKTVTLSFYARCGANFSATNSQASVILATGTGTDQNLITGFTGGAATGSSTITLSTTATRYTLTATLPANTNQIAVQINFTPTNTAGAADYLEITGIQLEEGSVATPFERRPYQVELALCQRYYQIHGVTGVATSTTVVTLGTLLPVQMRLAPTPVYTGSIRRTSDGATRTATTPGVSILNDSILYVYASSWSSPLVVGEGYDNNAGASITLSARL